MKGNKVDNGFTFTGPLAIILGVIIFFLLAIFILGNGSGNNKAALDKTKVGRVTTELNINSNTNRQGYVELSTAGLRIKDPEDRGILVEYIAPVKEGIKKISILEPGIYVRDTNKDFYNRCKYPVKINEVSLTDNVDKKYSKIINNKIYYVGKGTVDLSKCSNNVTSESSYVDNLRMYILANLSAN